jgi:hypothetical protein
VGGPVGGPVGGAVGGPRGGGGPAGLAGNDGKELRGLLLLLLLLEKDNSLAFALFV